MNIITFHGKITKDANSVLIKNNGVDCPLVSFMAVDYGYSYTKSEPLFIEVDYMKEPAMHIFDYLKKGKEVIVVGVLRSKSYMTKSGEEKQKYFISADTITFPGTNQENGGHK